MLRSMTVLSAFLGLVIAAPVSAQDGALGSLSPKPSAKDFEAIQGTWKVLRLEADGKPQDPKKYTNTTMVFQGDKATLTEQGFNPILFSYSLNEAKKEMDLWPVADLQKKRLLKSVYELKGDSLKICLAIEADRPTDLTTKPGDKRELFVMTRLTQDEKPKGKEGWKQFLAKEHNFSVELPAEPKKQTRNAPSPAGPITVTMYIAGPGPDRMTYISLHQKFPVPVADEATRQTALDSFRDGMLTGSKGKLNKETKGKFQGVSAREILVDMQGGLAQSRLKVFIIGDDLYALMAVGPGDISKNKDVEYYWNSFKQVNKKANDNAAE